MNAVETLYADPAVAAEVTAKLRLIAKLNEYPVDITRPEGGFLKSYVDYYSDCTDAPWIYHLCSALSILSAAAGNRIYLDVWGLHLFLNIWVLLVGESTEMRKSVTIALAQRQLRHALPERLYPTSFTVEKLEEVMAERPAGLVVSSEVSYLWQSLGKDYNKSGLQFLMQMYDGTPWERSTKKEGSNLIKDAGLSILAGSIPDWLTEGLSTRKGDEITSGALARFLLVPATEKEREFGLRTSMRAPHVEDELSAHLQRVANLQGEIEIPDDVRSLYDAFDKEIRGEVKRGRLHREYLPMYRRMSTATLKVAALYHLAGPTPTLRLSAADMMSAITLVNALMDRATTLLANEVSHTRSGGQAVALRRLLRQTPGQRMARGQLFRKLQKQMSLMEFDQAIKGLETAEEIRVETERSGGRPRDMVTLLESEGVVSPDSDL